MLSNEATLYAGGLNFSKKSTVFSSKTEANNNILCCFANLNNFLCQIKGVSQFYKDYEVFLYQILFLSLIVKSLFFEFRVIFSA